MQEVLLMDIEWFRDLVICVSGVVATVVFVIIAILSYSFYKGTIMKGAFEGYL